MFKEIYGNFTSETGRYGANIYTHDCFNRTERVRKSNREYIRNFYDPEGLRFKIEENGKTAWFVYDGRNIVAELEGEKLKAASIRGHELLMQKGGDGEQYYYLNNAHGDVEALIDPSGVLVNRYRYDAFGNIIEARERVHNRFKYAGEQYDEVTGQYYLRARFYNPVIGRFTQEDVYRGDGLNLYAYVQNNPVNYVDPSGYISRRKAVGNTPGKKSKTGRAVIKRMEQEAKIITARDGRKFYISSDGQTYPLDRTANMSHTRDVVEFWNNEGKYYGERSEYSRAFMLNPNNYEIEHESINKSNGARLGITYDEVPKSLQERIDFIEKNKSTIDQKLKAANDMNDIKQYQRQLKASDEILDSLKKQQSSQKSSVKIGGKC